MQQQRTALMILGLFVFGGTALYYLFDDVNNPHSFRKTISNSTLSWWPNAPAKSNGDSVSRGSSQQNSASADLAATELSTAASSNDQKPADDDPSARAAAITKSYQYEREAQKIEILAKKFPDSKQQLIEIITTADPFKKENIKVKIHSMDEITQRQMGAIKVMSLKVLMSKETSKQTLLADLDTIIHTAEDTTLKDIAVSARESVKKGRPFFKDMVDAISKIKE